MISISLGRADLVDVEEVEVEDKIKVEFEAEVEVDFEEVDFKENLAGLGGRLIVFVGTGLGKFNLLSDKQFVKCLTGGGKYDFSDCELSEKLEGLLWLLMIVQVDEFDDRSSISL